MDSAISIVIMLFILSMINERIANFIKLHFSSKKMLGIKLGNLRVKSMLDDEEDDRSKRILVVNVICGTIISLFTRADLINILCHFDHPSDGIGWNKPFEDWNYLSLPVGCFLTGCFLSLGSKFWHDLLDLLLYTKNLKEKLVDDRTYSMNSLEGIERFINTPEYKLASIAVDQYRDSILAMPGVLSIGTGYVKNGADQLSCVEIHVASQTAAATIPKQFAITPIAGENPILIPAKIVVTGDYPSVNSAEAGGSICNKTHALGTGTLGAIVKANVGSDHYILSCFHVLNGDTNWSRISATKDIISIQNGIETVIGELFLGYRTSEIDAGIALLNNGTEYSNHPIKDPKTFREIKPSDAIKNTMVTLLGAKTAVISTGFIYNDSWPATFKYPDNRNWELKDLIVLTTLDPQTNQYKAISKGGDSGALVIDDSNIAIGILVGADQSFSYAIKLKKIADAFDIALI
jgi:hypothetical protein